MTKQRTTIQNSYQNYIAKTTHRLKTLEEQFEDYTKKLEERRLMEEVNCNQIGELQKSYQSQIEQCQAKNKECELLVADFKCTIQKQNHLNKLFYRLQKRTVKMQQVIVNVLLICFLVSGYEQYYRKHEEVE